MQAFSAILHGQPTFVLLLRHYCQSVYFTAMIITNLVQWCKLVSDGKYLIPSARNLYVHLHEELFWCRGPWQTMCVPCTCSRSFLLPGKGWKKRWSLLPRCSRAVEHNEQNTEESWWEMFNTIQTPDENWSHLHRRSLDLLDSQGWIGDSLKCGDGLYLGVAEWMGVCSKKCCKSENC